MKSKLIAVVLFGFLIGAATGAVLLLMNRGPGQAPVETSGQALIGGPFKLVDQTGKTVTDQDFRGRYMLVFFGYTHCPDICPAELQVMANAMDELGPDASKVVPVFITLDPKRDTPQALAAYLKNFGPRFVGLTGSSDQIAQAAKAYRVAYTEVADNASGDYTVDHSALSYLMSPQGEYLDHFTYGTSAKDLAQTIKRYF